MIYNKLAGSLDIFEKERLLFTKDAWSAYFFEDIEKVKQYWLDLQPANRQLLGFDFLNAIQKVSPIGMQMYYLLIQHNQQLVGLAYFQLMDLDLQNSVRKGAIPDSFLKKQYFRFKSFIRSRIKINVLVCGNFLTSGDQSHHFIHSKHEDEGLQFIIDSSEALLEKVGKFCKPLRGVLFKDLYDNNKNQKSLFIQNKFLATKFQPRMVLNIDPSWTNLDDYLSAVTSKYRVRIKKAKSKIKDFEIRSLEADEILEHAKEINELFEEIISNVSFNALKFPEGYFANLKKELGADFEFLGFFKDDIFKGFFTIIHGNEEMEAHYIGIRNKDNKAYSIYFNLLLELTRIGIERGYKRVNFSRTAMEIKSSVGALGEDLNCYYKHPNKLLQSISIMLFRFLKPAKVQWKPRSPFKKK
jgi:hypothetical protein